MRSIGIREIRQRASRYLREVESGATIQVTDRGRPIARLVPLGEVGILEDLVASARLTPARGDLFELGDPLDPRPGRRLPSDTLARVRSSER